MNRYKYWLLILFLLIANTLILLNRNKGFKYFPYKTYNELYVTDSSFYLKDVHFNADSLELFFSLNLASRHYTIVIDDSLSGNGVVRNNNTIIIPVQNGFHQYKLAPNQDKDSEIIVEVDHSNNGGYNFINEFVYCNLPGPLIKVSPYNTWTKGKESFTASEVQSGLSFLKNNSNVFSLRTDLEKLTEICKVISRLRPNSQGTKASTVSLLPPFEQLQLALQNKVNLDCGNYSALFYYLCSIIDLPNRAVTFAGPAGNWQYGVHYYNEVYLREKQQWVLCDGVTNAYMPHDSTRFYNAADVNKMAHINSFGNKYVYTFKNDSLLKTDYQTLSSWHWYYNRNNANLCYIHPGTGLQDGMWNYLKDFYSFNRNFDFYSDQNANDWLKIFIKLVAFYVLIIVVVLYVFWEIKTWRKSTGSM